MKKSAILFSFMYLLCCVPSFAQETEHVRISVEKFEELLKAAEAKPTPTPVAESLPPIDFSLSAGSHNINVRGQSADITCVINMNVLSKEWVKIPLVSSETAISSVHLDGTLTSLKRDENRYYLHIKSPGLHNLEIHYSVPVERLIGGYRLQYSAPMTVSGKLKMTIPGQWQVVNVLPSEGLTISPAGSVTNVDAVLVSSDRVQILWGEQKKEKYSFTSGIYTVKVEEKGIFIKATYKLEIDSDQPLEVPVVSSSYGLISLTVDGKEPAITQVGNMYGLTLQGHGTRRIETEFSTNIDRTDGQPTLQLQIPQSPISRFTFEVPGKRTVSVFPVVPLNEEANDKKTTVTVNFPKTTQVKFLWSDSRPVPEQMVRMNGEGYYAISAEEGVLRINSNFFFDIISGKTSEITMKLPDNVVIYQVIGDGITDWRTFSKDKENQRFLSTYFDQPRHGKYQLQIVYDKLIPKSDSKQGQEISIPIIEPQPVHRYQGTVLLLSGEMLEFVSKQVEGFIPVGAEVIPAEIKSKLKSKVAYGYKYVGTPSPLIVQLEKPQKDEAKFDSTVNTLYTIEEGILKARSSVDITVKSGVLKEISFTFEKETTILDLVSPSLLKFVEVELEGGKNVNVQFTQAMEGSFRIDISFETLLDTKKTSVNLHPVKTQKAEVERGYIGVESLTTVEVITEKSEEIQEIDTKELPLWLTERTTRPILLAYKYSHLPYNLIIRITRHDTVPTMEARITAVNAMTDFQKDGNALTVIQYTIVNNTKQFLRIRMPESAKLWQAEISGNEVKSALDKDNRYILPLPRSKEPIICAIKYSQKVKEMGYLGRININLPKTDLYSSTINWKLNLSPDYSYFLTSSNMEYHEQHHTFTLWKPLSTVDDETLYFKTNFRKKTVRIWASLLAFVLTLIVLWLYKRRNDNPTIREKIVAAVLLIIFILSIIFLRLPLTVIAMTVLAVMLLTYLFASGQKKEKR